MNENEELISVIVPVYNVEKYLEQCINSIINQTYKNLEIILIDDGSTDNSGKICDEWEKKDNRIKAIHKENGGVSSARNLGLDIAKGKYIGFVDSDDFIKNDMYEYLYEIIKKESADISSCRGYYYFDDGTIKEWKKEKENYVILDKITALDWISNFSKLGVGCYEKLYKKELFENIRFPVGKIGEDFVVTYKVVLESSKIIYTTEPKYYYRQQQGSYTRNNKVNYDNMDFSKEYMEMIIRDYPQIKDNAIKKYIYTCLNVYDNIIVKDNKAKRKREIVNEIRKNYKEVSLKNVTLKKRLQLLLFIYNRVIYDMIFKISYKIKRL